MDTSRTGTIWKHSLPSRNDLLSSSKVGFSEISITSAARRSKAAACAKLTLRPLKHHCDHRRPAHRRHIDRGIRPIRRWSYRGSFTSWFSLAGQHFAEPSEVDRLLQFHSIALYGTYVAAIPRFEGHMLPVDLSFGDWTVVRSTQKAASASFHLSR